MLIKQVQLIGFGTFKKKTITFRDGFNVVIGPNEAGKSTIQSAIYIAFFGKPKDYARWGEANQPCRVIIDYQANDINYRLIRDLAAQEISLTGEPGDGLTNKKLINNLIREHLGNADEKIFENTAFIRANELASLESNDSSAIKNRIETLMAGSRRVAASEAIKRLMTAYKGVAGTIRQKGLGGRIGVIHEHINELDEDLSAANEYENRRANLRALIKEIDDSIAAKERSLAELAPLLRAFANNERLRVLSQRRQAVSKRLEEILELCKRQTRLEHDLAGMGMDNLPDGADKKILLMEQSLADKQPLIKKDEKLFNQSKERMKKLRTADRIRSALAIFLIITGPAIGFLYNAAAGILLAFLGLATVIYLFTVDKRALLLSEISALEEEVGQEKKAAQEYADGIANILSSGQADDSRDFLDKYTDWDKKTRELRLIEEKIDMLLAGDSLEDIKAARRDLLDEEEKISAKLKKGAKAALSTISAAEIIGKRDLYDGLKSAVAEVKEEKIYLDGRLRELEKEINIGDIEEEIAYLKHKKSQEALKAKALMIAGDNLESAAKELSARIIPQLAVRSKDYFHKFTADKKRELSLDDQLRITLGGDVELSSERLSTGTRDQVFFALRLAMAELIFSEAKPPFILDDPFVYFDESRLQRVVDILAEIAKKQQIILFSHTNIDHRYAGRFNIITL